MASLPGDFQSAGVVASDSGAGIAIAVVIPCYRVRAHILGVLDKIGPEVSQIYVIDDMCPEHSGAFVRERCADSRVQVIEHSVNQGVGGAVITGYRRALANGADIVVKVDGDGQMDPRLISRFVRPIILGDADYTKGNRFYNPEDVKKMPLIRVIGNTLLSFLNKFSTGYWSIFDPTNGYTAIHTAVLEHLKLESISRRYFFESDMLFRLNIISCRVIDVPLVASYGDEKSNLSINQIFFEFLWKHLRNTFKRIFYSYFLRDFSIASVQLIFGFAALLFGLTFGAHAWYQSAAAGVEASSGTVMVAALPIIIGVQLLLAFWSYDIARQPQIGLYPRLLNYGWGKDQQGRPVQPGVPANRRDGAES